MRAKSALYAFIMKGPKCRVSIIKAIDQRMTPSQIWRKGKKFNSKLSMNHTSDLLRLFKKCAIVKCLNEEDKVGRLYELTEQGQAIKDEILKYEILFDSQKAEIREALLQEIKIELSKKNA